MKNDQLEKVTLPKEAWSDLDSETQFAISLLGHIFNEVMTLQKLMVASHPYDQQTKIERSGSVCQSTLLQRILVGKLFEAKARVNSREVHRFLTTKCFVHLKDGAGAALLKEFNQAISSCDWLSDARNQHSMHYPTLDLWRNVLDQMRDAKEAFNFVIGSRDGDILYETSDQIANMSFFENSGNGSWKKGVDEAFEDVKGISRKLNNLITISLDAFFSSYGKSKPASKRLRIKKAKSFSTPHLLSFKIPYFFDLRASSDERKAEN